MTSWLSGHLAILASGYLGIWLSWHLAIWTTRKIDSTPRRGLKSVGCASGIDKLKNKSSLNANQILKMNDCLIENGKNHVKIECTEQFEATTSLAIQNARIS